MLDNFWQLIFRTMSLLSGQPFQESWILKARLILQAAVFLIIFSSLFFYFYRKYFWQEEINRKLFWWTIGILGVIVATKFFIFYLAKGYVPDRLLFFGIPSPKFGSLLWFLLAAGSFGSFLYFRRYFEIWPAWKFLVCLWLIFWTFSLGIAGMREGSFSIYEPFTREYWEYVGFLPHINNLRDFLSSYVTVISDPDLSFAKHSKTHPPGYVLTLYVLQKLFGAGIWGLAILVVGLGGLFAIPVYYFWQQWLCDATLRKILPVFIFTPSLIMFSATSMDVIMLFFSWLALGVVFWGWRNNPLIAFVGGLLGAAALLMNFLFLTLGLVFLFFGGYLWSRSDQVRRTVILRGALWSLAGFIAPFLFLHWWTGYSAIENFLVANSIQHTVVIGTSSSLLVYILFAFINIFSFSFYLGIPNIFLLTKTGIRGLSENRFLIVLGFLMVTLFTLSGFFQGEVERIWLFLYPLFVVILNQVIQKIKINTTPILFLLVFQIIITQTLFFTYW